MISKIEFSCVAYCSVEDELGMLVEVVDMEERT